MFSTPIEIASSLFKINYQDRMMSFGSCFAENIGSKLNAAYFDIDSNPFGVLFNPISISNSLELLMNKEFFVPNDLFEHNAIFNSFAHSSLFSDISLEGCLDKINSRMELSKNNLNHANVLLITFGTAWVYENVKTAKVVSNCHKLPSSHFVRRRLTVTEIVETYQTLLNKLTELQPRIKVIFSVSPIRHWKDGAHDNNVSKGILHMAIDELQSLFKDAVHYFPAYEIQMDELRDYRFYAADMLHPSEVAVDYIWKRFGETYFSEETVELKRRCEQLRADLSHRLIHPDSKESLFFVNSVERKRVMLCNEYPFLSERLQ